MTGIEQTDKFLIELNERTEKLSGRSTTGHTCVKICLNGCKGDFVVRLEEFLVVNDDLFKLHIRGLDYYVELLSGDNPMEEYSKSKL